MESIYSKFQLNRISIHHFTAFQKIEKFWKKNLGKKNFSPPKLGSWGCIYQNMSRTNSYLHYRKDLVLKTHFEGKLWCFQARRIKKHDFRHLRKTFQHFFSPPRHAQIKMASTKRNICIARRIQQKKNQVYWVSRS